MSDKKEGGLTINAGDRAYVPPGGLQLWINPDGTMGSRMSLAIDPWLPDLSPDAGTPVDVMQTIARRGFTVGSICTGQRVSPSLAKQRVSGGHLVPREAYHGIEVRRLVGTRFSFSWLAKGEPD